MKEEMKNHGKKWFFLFTIGLALMLAYKLIESIGSLTGVIDQ